MWKPNPGPQHTPSGNSTFWWCRPFAAQDDPLCRINRHQPLPAWRRKALLK